MGLNRVKNGKIRLLTVIETIVILIIALVLIGMFTINIAFAGTGTTLDIFGYNLYLVETSAMEPEIKKNSIVFAENDLSDGVDIGSYILCEIGESESKAMLIVKDTYQEDGVTYFEVISGVDTADISTTITRDEVIGACRQKSYELGVVINFAKTPSGIVLLVVVPSLILIAIQLFHIIRARKIKKNSEKLLLEDLPENKNKIENPLFEPNKFDSNKKSVQEKKSTISENFSAKNTKELSATKKSTANKPERKKSIAEDTQQLKKIADEHHRKTKEEKQTKDLSRNSKTMPIDSLENPMPKKKLDVSDLRKDRTAPLEKPLYQPPKVEPKSEPKVEPKFSATVDKKENKVLAQEVYMKSTKPPVQEKAVIEPTSNKPAEPINKAPAKKKVSFEELMQVIENEKSKLK